MKDRACAEKACRDPNPIIDGRKANVNLAYLGAKPRGNAALASKRTLPYFLICAELYPLRFRPGAAPAARWNPSDNDRPLF